MQTKYNIGDTLWRYVFYTNPVGVILRQCTVVGILIRENGATLYKCRVEGYTNPEEYAQAELWPDKVAAINAAKEYCCERISILQKTINELDNQLP